ncbi:MAG: hypothetical protein MJ082_00200 [Clostridia bacterium]|nr:hypothetical protein [Clostridia bacterium]
MKLKLLTVLLLLVMIFSMAAGCGKEKNNTIPDRTYDEGEILAAATDLIPKTAVFNFIFWGEGIPAAEEPFTFGKYAEADGTWLEEHGFVSVSDVREKAGEVFSASMMRWIENTVLTGVQAENGYVSIARYLDYETEGSSYFMVNPDAKVYVTDSTEYDLDSLQVLGSKGETVKVRLDCTVTDKESGEKKTVSLTVNLFEEEAGWRIDSTTYQSY